MSDRLPMTGSAELLHELSDFVPDQFINEQWPLGPTGGRRRCFSAAQLWRLHLLLCLTPARSVNLLVKLLEEQRAWRRFAHLSHRQRVPDVRRLHAFRAEVGVGGLRQINEQLATALVQPVVDRQDTIALIDATDLPAACHGFKKRPAAPTRPRTRPSVDARSKRGKATGISATRNTRCGSGLQSTSQPFCWCR